MRKTVAFALALFALGCIVGHVAGCRSPGEAASGSAEAAYTLELLRCVDDAKTLAESRACRQRVDARWGITETEAGR